MKTKTDVWLAVYRDELKRLTKRGFDEDDVRLNVIQAADKAADAFMKKFPEPQLAEEIIA